MKLAAIPNEEAVALLRSLGLLIGQAGMYGPTHNVTQNAARALFPELSQTINKHGAIEITLRDDKLLVNGDAIDVGGSAGKNLSDRMKLHKIEGIAFLSPADLDEFLKCITLFGTPPMTLAAAGGFESALKTASLRSVQLVSVQYRRIAKDQTVVKADADRPTKPRTPRRPGAAAIGEVLDLAAAMPEAAGETMGSGSAAATLSPHAEARVQALTARQQRSSALAEMLRQTASLLEANQDDLASETHHASILDAFHQIHDTLLAMTKISEREIKSFASQVNADRKTIAGIESAARRRGIGLQLTREELMTRYSELSQEIVQPLTVSSGVLEMMSSGRAGSLTESQRELLQMAAESVERVNTLVNHLKKISGMPDTLTPDAQILKEAYQTTPVG
ncbi:MAG: histidine kinase dimerization/phospho-acceptor domain-containing protein [Kiritimatiellia bacterium]